MLRNRDEMIVNVTVAMTACSNMMDSVEMILSVYVCIKNRAVNKINVACCVLKNVLFKLSADILNVILRPCVHLEYSKLITLYFMRNMMNTLSTNVGTMRN